MGLRAVYRGVLYDPSWGDGSGDWTNYYAPGWAVTLGHHWTDNGGYRVKVCAEDEYGAVSAWSEKLFVVIQDDDDSIGREVGVWALGDLGEWWWQDGDLPNAVPCAQEFYNVLIDEGFTGRYAKYNEENVQEAHFEKSAYGGEDWIYVDSCDFIYVRTHGDCAEFIVGTGSVPYSMDRVELYQTVEWGDVDLEWAFISACKVLCEDEISTLAGAFNRKLHGICGYHSTAYDVVDEGLYLAYYAVDGLEEGEPCSIGRAWKLASKRSQPWYPEKDRVWGAIYRGINQSTNTDFYYEHLPGYKGGMFPDPNYGDGEWTKMYNRWRCLWP